MAAVGELDSVVAAVLVDLDNTPCGQGVHDRNTDAMQSAGHLVAGTAELSAGVQHRERDLDSRHPLHLRVGMGIDRDATAVVGDPTAAVREQHDVDLRAVARHGLVDGVVDNLIDAMVQASRAGGADVHARALADRLQAFENGNVLRAVVGGPTVVG